MGSYDEEYQRQLDYEYQIRLEEEQRRQLEEKMEWEHQERSERQQEEENRRTQLSYDDNDMSNVAGRSRQYKEDRCWSENYAQPADSGSPVSPWYWRWLWSRRVREDDYRHRVFDDARRLRLSEPKLPQSQWIGFLFVIVLAILLALILGGVDRYLSHQQALRYSAVAAIDLDHGKFC